MLTNHIHYRTCCELVFYGAESTIEKKALIRTIMTKNGMIGQVMTYPSSKVFQDALRFFFGIVWVLYASHTNVTFTEAC